MIYLILLTLMSSSFADPTWKWAKALKIVEKHEFYTNNEIIKRPVNAWQTLFGVVYNDPNLKTMKDCLYYKVPGDEPGILKLKTIASDRPCEEALYLPGDEEWKDLKALQYSVQENLLSVSLTNAQFQIEKWDVPLVNVFEHPTPKPLMSSAEYRAPKMIFLTPYRGTEVIRPVRSGGLEDKKICHDIAEDCKEISPSVCSECTNGWHEMTNGCVSGPKFCGVQSCGLKGQPACRRGMVYQRVEKTYSCREDASFAYCANGLSIQCQGHLPYCL